MCLWKTCYDLGITPYQQKQRQSTDRPSLFPAYTTSAYHHHCRRCEHCRTKLHRAVGLRLNCLAVWSSTMHYSSAFISPCISHQACEHGIDRTTRMAKCILG